MPTYNNGTNVLRLQLNTTVNSRTENNCIIVQHCSVARAILFCVLVFEKFIKTTIKTMKITTAIATTITNLIADGVSTLIALTLQQRMLSR
jgi:hypothetical protein